MKGILERHEDSIEGGADIAFDAVDHCRPAPQSGHQSGNRASANRLIGLKALADENLSGKGVNVVDRGLNNNDIESKLKGKFGGGWAIDPENGGPRIAPGSLKVVRGVEVRVQAKQVAGRRVAERFGARRHGDAYRDEASQQQGVFPCQGPSCSRSGSWK